MEASGLFGCSKIKQLKFLPNNLKPKTIYVQSDFNSNKIHKELESLEMGFPILVKPNNAERGKGIQIIRDKDELAKYAQNANYSWLIQEYINYPFEVGVFYYKKPSEQNGKITSVVIKEFLSVIGDGESTVEKLMLKNKRTKLYIGLQKTKLKDKLYEIPNKDEIIIIEPIGNHNRGTTFRNGNYLINANLEEIFSKISTNLPDFYFGRFDLRTPSLNDFCIGINYKILEINGSNSEPAHIYEPNTPFWEGLKTICKHWKIQSEISRENTRLGYKTDSFASLWKIWKENRIN